MTPCETSLIAISIHALRGEGDEYDNYKSDISAKISIHALRGEGDGWQSTYSRRL